MEHPHIRGLSEWKPLARGGLAVVWEARQLSLDRLVAVKVYWRELDEGARRRFLREVAAAGRLSDHPGVVTAYDAGMLPHDRPYLILELCRGGSLTQRITSENRPSEEWVRQVGVRIADALAAAHAYGVLHRDVKPPNILVDRYGNPRLADFGLAVVADTEAAVGDALGVTPAYAPPEAFGTRPATEAGDVFSLAATLYALLAGRPPRGVGSGVPLEQMAEVATKPIDAVPGVNWHLMGVLMSALSIDPAARPTAARFRDELANLPAPHEPKRRPYVRAAGSSSFMLRRRRPALEHPTTAKASRTAGPVPTGTVPSAPTPHPVASATTARWRPERRVGVLALVAFITVIASATAWLIMGPGTQRATSGGPPLGAGSSRGVGSTPTATSTRAASDTDATPRTEAIQLHGGSAVSAKPFQTVPIRGTFRGGDETFLRVQRWEEGTWVAFPLPTSTDASGQFTAYVELGRPGRYRLRVLHPDSGVKSEPFVLTIRG